jgi:outer membrane lipoprotein-sorting protein
MTVTASLALLAALLQAGPTQAPGPTPKDTLEKSLTTYAAAKTYDAAWSYVLASGADTQEMQMEVRAKAPARLIFRVSAAKGAREAKARPVPEMLVVLDGATAWYQNTTEKVYFKVALPKEPKYTPLMFFPQIAASGEVRRLPDVQAGGKTILVLEADRAEGGTTRMEIDAATHRIRKIVVENIVALIKRVSTITVLRETFDGDLPDKLFAYKPPKGLKEIQAPPGAGAMFGQ